MQLSPGMTVVDGTLGGGGHASEILKGIGPSGRLIALDQDPRALKIAQEALSHHKNISFHHENFRNIDTVLDSLNIDFIDAVILDIGMSSIQLDDGQRGFSFEHEGPLDMRMNPDLDTCAEDLVNGLSQDELENIFRVYGEERNARRFARAVCWSRDKQRITTTHDLAEIIRRSAVKQQGSKKSHTRRKRHPATRIFQALRIVVNQELEILAEAIPRAWARIRGGGRFVIISFHSLEDRIVKNLFRDWGKEGVAKVITKKPLQPTFEEIKENSRARSSKLRTVEKNQ